MEPRRYNHLNDFVYVLSVNKNSRVWIYLSASWEEESFGQLVLLSFDVTTFTPAAYQGRSLQPPYMDILS